MTDRYITVAATEIPFNIKAGQDETLLIPLIPNTAPDTISGAGAIDPDVYFTAATSTSTDAWTLADPSGPAGQMKKVVMVVDGGTSTLTLASAVSAALDVITFADAGDTAELIWTGSAWRVLALYGAVDAGPSIA